jgi:hypothetical protein
MKSIKSTPYFVRLKTGSFRAGRIAAFKNAVAPARNEALEDERKTAASVTVSSPDADWAIRRRASESQRRIAPNANDCYNNNCEYLKWLEQIAGADIC